MKMSFDHVFDKLSIHFDHDFVKKIEYNASGLARIYSCKNRLINEFSTKASIAFNSQYGTPISNDGKLLYVGSWANGLYCYSISNGKILWHQGPGKVRNILVFEKILIIEMCGRGIYIRDSKNGELLNEVKMSSIETFLKMGENEVFVGPKRNKYFIYSAPNLELIDEVDSIKLNVKKCLSFSILSVNGDNENIVVGGFENYENRNFQNDKQVNYVRIIKRPNKRLERTTKGRRST